ncbi:MAG TPA: molybdopterin-synthase adenylyltransferase MoeB [Kiritimatiellia bacterium]|jgi:adenylyltransferase/sulfurtransferase
MSPQNGPDLSKEELLRYSRHLVMPDVGIEGQRRLRNASVLLVGTGGLGSPVALYLAAAGVGRIGLVDFDVVDATNLQRQVLHGTADVGKPKLHSARRRIADLNPFVHVDTHEARLTSANALSILKPYEIVVDGSDNFPTRYLVNDACVLLGKPNVYGSIFRFEGQASVFSTGNGPCYRCLYPEPPPPGAAPNCAEGGVLGVLPGLVGLIQATETIKLILGQGQTLAGRLLLVDALAMKFREMKIAKDPACPVCGRNPTIKTLVDYEAFCGTTTPAPAAVTATELKAELDGKQPVVLLDVREPREWDLCRLPGAVLIPFGDLESRLDDLDRSSRIVAYCRTGVRSAHAVELLHRSGFASVRNLTGGLHAWSDDVDPSIPKY